MEATVDFVEQLLNTGGTLARPTDNLISAFVADGMEADAAEAEALEALAGTIIVGLTKVSAADVARAAELMELAMQVVMKDLERALEHSNRRERRNDSATNRSERRRSDR